MNAEAYSALLALALAWLAGSVIGLERTFNGRVAGFRTHGIVAIASAAVVLIARAPLIVPASFPTHADMFDPTRLAQGVMTGVGFLGAGVIFKEGVSVQGLTTAASVWVTAAIGLALGLELYVVGAAATAAVLFSLVVFRWVEAALPVKTYAFGIFRFDIGAAPDPEAFRALIVPVGRADELSYKLINDGATFEYHAYLQATGKGALDDLALRLRTVPGLREFELSRISK